MSEETLYVFTGVAGEYALKPIADFLRSRQCQCLEVDFSSINFNLSDWKRLTKRKIVFITSSHLEAGKERVEHVSENSLRFSPTIIAPLELLDILKPVKSIYVPHDLTTPLGYYEWKFIDQFDLFFNPIASFPVYSNLIETKELGWINYNPKIKTLPKNFVPKKKIIFVSIFIYLQNIYGLQGLFNYFAPLLDEDTAIKFPLWGNHKTVEAYFRENSSVQVCEAHWSSIELMQQFDVVIGNHVSSVLTEAAFLNKKVFCLESNIATPYPNYQRSFLGYLPNLQFFPYFDPQARHPLNRFLEFTPLKKLVAEELLKPFDFEQAFELITS
ncbi:MAG: hypothetical protein V4471_07730 [Pseudomonadota bacterium]